MLIIIIVVISYIFGYKKHQNKMEISLLSSENDIKRNPYVESSMVSWW